MIDDAVVLATSQISIDTLVTVQDAASARAEFVWQFGTCR